MDFLLFVFSRLAAAILLPQQQSPEDESKPLPIVGFKGKCSIKSVVLWQWRHYARNRKKSDEKIKMQKKSFLCFCPPKSKKEIECYSKWGAIDEKILKKYLRIQNIWSSIRILRKVYIFRMYILKVFRQHCLSIPSWKIREALSPASVPLVPGWEKNHPRKLENIWNFLVTSVTFVTKFTTPSKNIFEQSLLHLWHLWQKRSRNSISHLFVPRAPPALCFAAFLGRAGSRTQWFREPEAQIWKILLTEWSHCWLHWRKVQLNSEWRRILKTRWNLLVTPVTSVIKTIQ